ncbi:MAG: methyltransferase domain-containing protein [Woeseia sp.]
MSSVKAHYDSLLAPHYSWILGDFDTAYRQNARLFEDLEIVPGGNGLAVDLGCGPGCQSVPLAERGFSVLAIDFCAELLGELAQHGAHLPVTAICDDISNFRNHLPQKAELIVCMGDSIVHLPDKDTVEQLIRDCADAVIDGGSVILSLRDYTQPAPTGPARFIPIRSDDQRIFTCFLETVGDTIQVHDILHTRQADGWHQHVSAYRKLRLDYRWVMEVLVANGLDIQSKSLRQGFITLHAMRTR